MSRVLTNNVSLAFALESSVGVLPGSPTWFLTEPNSIGKFGAEVSSVARRPISKSRQRQKGTVTDLDSGVELEHDLTKTIFTDQIEAFVFAEAANANLSFRANAINGTGLVIAAASANQAGKLQFVSTGPKSLMYLQGYTNAANNGLKVLTADTAAAGTAIAFSGAVAETPATNSNARADLAGVRAATGDLAVTVSGTTGTLTSGNNGVTGSDRVDFTTLGLTVGQFIHIGGLAAGQQFSAGVAYVRVLTIAAQTLTFDKLVGTLVTDAGTGDTVDLLFGRFIRNVAVDAAADDNRYVERTYQFEAAFTDLGGVGTPKYEYAKGNFASELTFNVPLTDKASMSLKYVGTTSATPSTTRATNASTPVSPLLTTAFSTASDVANIGTDAITSTNTCFKSVTLTLKNNVSPEKCLGTLGASFMNAGIFEVDLEAQALFAESTILDSIRNNTTVTFNLIMENANGAIAVDLPAMTVTGGDREFPEDKSVLVNLKFTAFAHPTFNTSIGISLFPVTP